MNRPTALLLAALLLLARPENRIDFNARSEAFLAKYLGGRFEPMEGEKIPGSTAVVKVVGGK